MRCHMGFLRWGMGQGYPSLADLSVFRSIVSFANVLWGSTMDENKRVVFTVCIAKHF